MRWSLRTSQYLATRRCVRHPRGTTGGVGIDKPEAMPDQSSRMCFELKLDKQLAATAQPSARNGDTGLAANSWWRVKKRVRGENLDIMCLCRRNRITFSCACQSIRLNSQKLERKPSNLPLALNKCSSYSYTVEPPAHLVGTICSPLNQASLADISLTKTPLLQILAGRQPHPHSVPASRN